MSWTFHPAREKFAYHAADWDRLNAELYGGHPYYDSRFVGSLLKYFASGTEHLCLFQGNGGIRAALILVPRGLGCWDIFRPSQAQIAPILVGDDILLADLFSALPGLAWKIDFHAIDPRYAPAFLPSLLETIVSEQALTIGIGPNIEFDKYWQERPKKLRSNIRRYTNRVEREGGGASFCYLGADAEMHEGVCRFGELESGGWKGVAGTAVAIENCQGMFYAEVMSLFAKTGQAEICELAVGGRLAASRLLIRNAKMIVALKTSYDESLASFAPGRLLLHHVAQQQLNEYPERTIEFYTNATSDQFEWSTFNCCIRNFELFRNDVAKAAYSFLRVLKRHFVPPLETRFSSACTQTESVDLSFFASVDELAADGCSIDEFSPRENVEESLAWFDLLQKEVFPDDPSVRYYVATSRGQPKAVLPLRQRIHRGVRTLESLSNYYTSLYSPLIGKDSDPQVVGHLLSEVMRQTPGTHVMRFAPMDPESPIYSALLRELSASKWIPLTFFCFGNWYLKVVGGWEDYLRTRSAGLRSSLKRMSRKFAEDGGELELITNTLELERGIAAYNEVYSASWKKPEPYPDFVPQLMRLLAANGMLRLGIARIGDIPIAAQFWIVAGRRASIYKVAYHEDYSRYSPGTVLTGFMLQHAIEDDRVNEVDFLIGDDKYKQIWMSDRRERWGIIAYNAGTFVGFALFIKEMGGRFAKLVKVKVGTFTSRFKRGSGGSK